MFTSGHEQVLSENNLSYPNNFKEALEQSKSGVPMAPEYVAHFWRYIGARVV